MVTHCLCNDHLLVRRFQGVMKNREDFFSLHFMGIFKVRLFSSFCFLWNLSWNTLELLIFVLLLGQAIPPSTTTLSKSSRTRIRYSSSDSNYPSKAVTIDSWKEWGRVRYFQIQPILTCMIERITIALKWGKVLKLGVSALRQSWCIFRTSHALGDNARFSSLNKGKLLQIRVPWV